MNTGKNLNKFHLRKSGYQFKSLIYIALFFSVLFVSCNSDNITRNSYYTFTEEMMGRYFMNRPDSFSEFRKLLDTTEVMGLLNAYGHYTCFAPTNEAMHAFYASRGRTSLEDFSADTLKKIAYDHIIKDEELGTETFLEGRLPYLTMSKRYISVTFSGFQTGDHTIRVNKTSPILKPDVIVHNGVVHVIGEVLKPTEKTLVEAINDDPKFRLFSEALLATHLDEKLNLIEDESYSYTYWNNYYDDVPRERLGTTIYVPEFKKYGYTALMESDSTYEAHGIQNLEDMKAYAKMVYDAVFPEDAGVEDITDPRNSLNKFVAYHLINKQIGRTKFIIDYYNTSNTIQTYDMYEYVEMMCPKTLMEVRTLRNSNRTNVFNYNSSTGEFITLTDDYDNDALNGVYHEIDGILQYDLNVASEVSSKRLRLDLASFFPELTNNNMRGIGDGVNNRSRFILPHGYVDRLEFSEQTVFFYYCYDSRLIDFQGDEIFLLEGLYEFTITTPIIPKGTYEVRMCYHSNGNRGAVQMYWDGVPTGIPLDLNILATNPSIGYQLPGSDSADPNGYENDKTMRNRGYMKGPSSYKSDGGFYSNATVNVRLSSNVLRRILGIYTFNEVKEHKFHIKASRTGQFQMDYLEFVPVEAIEGEGID
ncbi:fasciclin domain-containing protein [Saccharicrinis sp. FJH2]|uniref:fasciclin domain-containing protein n=1 Tax=Saccharicrinis sp. FJH65 TaxID=3344659 RepID=UPI0035F223F6